ncbi:DUF3658 domain-containing protein [Viridibacillus arvi]|uniref:DUF3658 domain-containing protein n=1 Tax=Viridibacillus arvi TaxID=263475 RepID=UPI003CFC7B08
MSQEERKRYEHEWAKLSIHKENLRVWENQNIYNVDEGYYDDYIIHTARELHVEREMKIL